MNKRLVLSLLYISTLFLVIALWETPYLAFICLSISSLLLLWVTKWNYVKVFVFCAFAGSISEIIAVKTGVWSYAEPQLLGIPIWLPLVWGSASILFVQLFEKFSRKQALKK